MTEVITCQHGSVRNALFSYWRIKGKISDNGRVYEVPGNPNVEATQIDESRRERWVRSG